MPKYGIGSSYDMKVELGQPGHEIVYGGAKDGAEAKTTRGGVFVAEVLESGKHYHALHKQVRTLQPCTCPLSRSTCNLSHVPCAFQGFPFTFDSYHRLPVQQPTPRRSRCGQIDFVCARPVHTMRVHSVHQVTGSHRFNRCVAEAARPFETCVDDKPTESRKSPPVLTTFFPPLALLFVRSIGRTGRTHRTRRSPT